MFLPDQHRLLMNIGIENNYMRQLKRLAVILFSVTLAACSTVPKQKAYDPDKSLALNLAEAGGFTELSDQYVSAEDYDKLHSSGAGVVAGVGWAGANLAMPAPGFSSGWGFGLGLLSMVRSTYTPERARQIVAWMPREMAEDPLDAQEKFRAIATEALDKTLAELKWTPDEFEFSRREGDLITATSFQTIGGGCPDASAPLNERCIAAVFVQVPETADTSPQFFGRGSYPSYFFKADGIYHGRVTLVGRGHADVDLPRFYLTLSKHLPEWAYFYIPPKQYIRLHETGNLDFPQIYYRGKMELFVRPK